MPYHTEGDKDKMEYHAMHSSTEEVPRFFDPNDLAFGSYGKHIDKYLGRSPADGPPGYIFQKVTYQATPLASKGSVAGMYKMSPSHAGFIFHNAENTEEKRINEDGANFALANDPAPLGIASQAKLVPGDMILGSILQLVDGRSSDYRTGLINAGLVANNNGEPNEYGPEISGQPGAKILSSAISGGKSASPVSLVGCSVASPNLNVYRPVVVATAASDLSPIEVGAPISAISVSGISPTSNSDQIKFNLHVYALVGAREGTVSHYTQPDPTFTMQCLTKQMAEHPVSMVY
jgi:hypothetical protein